MLKERQAGHLDWRGVRGQVTGYEVREGSGGQMIVSLVGRGEVVWI